jgi:hypothetical protein
MIYLSCVAPFSYRYSIPTVRKTYLDDGKVGKRALRRSNFNILGYAPYDVVPVDDRQHMHIILNICKTNVKPRLQGASQSFNPF